MSSNPTLQRRAASLLQGTRFHVYRTTHLPPFGGGWAPWDEVLSDPVFVRFERDVCAAAVFTAARELAMTRLLEVREWNGAGVHYVAVFPLHGSFTLVFAVVTPDGVFVVSPVPLSSLRRQVVKCESRES